MVEGGSGVFSYFFEHGLVDEVRVFVAPKLVGGASAPTPLAGEGVRTMKDAIHLEQTAWTAVGDDILLAGTIKRK